MSLFNSSLKYILFTSFSIIRFICEFYKQNQSSFNIDRFRLHKLKTFIYNIINTNKY